jgi:hypothetical protein
VSWLSDISTLFSGLPSWLHGALEDPSKWVAVFISSLALLVTSLGHFQKRAETKIALRKQLTELLEKLTDLNLESSKARTNPSQSPPNTLGLLNDQRRFFVRQAAFLVTQLPKQVSPYEYRLVADGFNDIDETPEAEKYFRMGIKKSKTSVDKTIITRQYARWLYVERRFGEAVDQFDEAAKAAEGKGDRLTFYRFECYERFANLAAENRDHENFKLAYEKAVIEARRYENPVRLEKAKERLAALDFGARGRPPGQAREAKSRPYPAPARPSGKRNLLGDLAKTHAGSNGRLAK